MSDRMPLELFVRPLAAVLLFVLSAVSACRTQEFAWQCMAVLTAANLLWEKTSFASEAEWILTLVLLFPGVFVFASFSIRHESPVCWIDAGMAAGFAVEVLVMITRRLRFRP